MSVRRVYWVLIGLVLVGVAAGSARAGWRVDGRGRLVFESQGQVLSQGNEDGRNESGGGEGDDDGGEDESEDDHPGGESSEVGEVAEQEDESEDEEEVETEVELPGEEIEVESEVRFGEMKVKIEQRDGRLVIKMENEMGEEEEVGEEEEFEIEERLEGGQIRVAMGSGERLVFARGRAGAETSLPISVDLETNSLIVTTPAGEKTVAVLPDAAVANLLAANVIDRLGAAAVAQAATTGELAGVEEIVTMGERNGVPVYEIEGLSEQKMLWLFPVVIEKTVVVSAETGEVVQTQMSLGQRILDILSV